MIDYESEVKKVEPDAWCDQIPEYHRYIIKTTKDKKFTPWLNGMGSRSASEAWSSAYQNLLQQGKIKGE